MSGSIETDNMKFKLFLIFLLNTLVFLKLFSILSPYTHIRIIHVLAQWINGISEPETKNLVKFFSETSTNTRSENQDLIWDHILSISKVLSSVCTAWNAKEYPMSSKYQSCNFTDPCILQDKLKSIYYRDNDRNARYLQ